MLNRLVTRDNLRHMGVVLGSYLCVMSESIEETTCHLFFSCRITSKVWDMYNK